MSEKATNPEMTPTQIMRRDRTTPHNTPSVLAPFRASGPFIQGPSLIRRAGGTRGVFEIDNRDRRPPHRRRCRIPASHIGGASVRSSQAGDTMAETGSTRVPRRINTLFASISTKGGRRVPHSPPRPPFLSRTRKAKARYTVWLRGPGGKRDCAELVLTAITQQAPPPQLPPTPLSIHRQAGTVCYTTGYSTCDRLQAGLACLWQILLSPLRLPNLH